MKTPKLINLISALLLILSVLLLINLKSYGQMLGTPLDTLKMELAQYGTQYTETNIGDTILIEWYARRGHVLFFRFESMPQRWYFVNGVSVYIEGTQSRIDRKRDQRALRREWEYANEGYCLGNKNVWLNPDGKSYVKWVDSEGK